MSAIWAVHLAKNIYQGLDCCVSPIEGTGALSPSLLGQYHSVSPGSKQATETERDPADQSENLWLNSESLEEPADGVFGGTV